MEALFILIPLSLLAIGIAIWIFLQMSDSGQFDDMDSPAYSILLDDDRPAASKQDTETVAGNSRSSAGKSKRN